MGEILPVLRAGVSNGERLGWMPDATNCPDAGRPPIVPDRGLQTGTFGNIYEIRYD
jgi:hypothetical protein